MLMTPADVRRHIEYKRDMHELDAGIAALMLAALDSGAGADYAALEHAAVFRDPPPVVYHTAPPGRRAVISAGGLAVSQPGDGGSWVPNKNLCRFLQASQPPGVYVTREPDTRGIFAHWPAWDIWEIRRLALPWQHDTLNPGCWSFTVGVPAPQLHLTGTFGPGAPAQEKLG